MNGFHSCSKLCTRSAIIRIKNSIYKTLNPRKELKALYRGSLTGHCQPPYLSQLPGEHLSGAVVRKDADFSLRFGEKKIFHPYSAFLNICGKFLALWNQGLPRRLVEIRPDTLNQPHVNRILTLTQLAE